MTQSELSKIMKQAVQPWREYGARLPDDMPPRGGDKRALTRVLNDAEIERENALDLLKVN
jgi:hypothetical protein